MVDEKRQNQRIAFNADVVILAEKVVWHCHLIDISLKGALVTFPEEIGIEVGDSYQMELNLGSEAAIHMTVEAMHHRDNLVGFAWHDIDLESLTHLRRLLELNMPEGKMIHRELLELG